jgi:hypothetical protein
VATGLYIADAVASATIAAAKGTELGALLLAAACQLHGNGLLIHEAACAACGEGAAAASARGARLLDGGS